MSENTEVFRCASCGAELKVDLNQATVFCSYCGAKNEIKGKRMDTVMNAAGSTFKAETTPEQVMAAADFAISQKDYKKANELLMAAILAGQTDYRLYISKAKMDMQLDDNRGLLESLSKLRDAEQKATGEKKSEISKEICNLMNYTGFNGVTPLHVATYNEDYDAVVYCVEHGADVNRQSSVNSARVTPLSIMYVDMPGLNRNPNTVKKIREYLVSHGASTKNIKNNTQKKRGFSIGKALLWIFFTPIMIIITIAKKPWSILGKILGIIFALSGYCLFLTIISWLFTGLGLSIGNAAKIPIEMDISDIAKKYVSGYNDYGYFDYGLNDIGSLTLNYKNEDLIVDYSATTEGIKEVDESYYNDLVHYEIGFDIDLFKEDTKIGSVYVSAKCNKYLSNGDKIDFIFEPHLDNEYKFDLSNSSFIVSGLINEEITDFDPRDYKDDQTVGKYTVKSRIIEDPRPGASCVSPWLAFDVYENDTLITTVKYYLCMGLFDNVDGKDNTSIKYDADNKYYKIEYGATYLVPYWVADFSPQVILAQTGILFNSSPKEAGTTHLDRDDNNVIRLY